MTTFKLHNCKCIQLGEGESRREDGVEEEGEERGKEMRERERNFPKKFYLLFQSCECIWRNKIYIIPVRLTYSNETLMV